MKRLLILLIFLYAKVSKASDSEEGLILELADNFVALLVNICSKEVITPAITNMVMA